MSIGHWRHLTILSSAAPFPSRLQSFPASGFFPMSWRFMSGGQSIGASASVLPMNIQGWSPLGWTGLISLQFKGLSRVFSSTTFQKHWFSGTQPFSGSHSKNTGVGLPFPSPVDHILSDRSTMTCLSWVVLQDMAHSFTELCKPYCHYKAVIHERAIQILFPLKKKPNWVVFLELWEFIIYSGLLDLYQIYDLQTFSSLL